MTDNTSEKHIISIHLTEEEYRNLKGLKQRAGLTWAGLMRQADFSHLQSAPTVANEMLADGGDAE